jgi:hypothetical protein
VATLGNADYKEIREYVYRKGFGKEELQQLATLPPEGTLKTTMQAAEDRTVTAFGLFRADMEAALGIPQNADSQALARKLYAGYLSWKLAHV